MKYIIFLGLSATLFAGFFDHDLSYYQSHPEEAKAKIESCQKEIAHAMIDKNKEKIISIQSDKECLASGQAYKEHERKIRQAAYEKEKKIIAEEKAKNDAIFNEAHKTYSLEFKSLKYDQFMEHRKDCTRYVSEKDYPKKAAKCKVFKELKNEKENEAVEEILSNYSQDKLFSYRDQVCKNTPYGDSKCEVARKAVNKAVKKQKDIYISDKILLKENFNECHKKYAKLYLNSKFMEAESIQKTYKCYTAKEAAMQVYKVFSLIHPIK